MTTMCDFIEEVFPFLSSAKNAISLKLEYYTSFEICLNFVNPTPPPKNYNEDALRRLRILLPDSEPEAESGDDESVVVPFRVSSCGDTVMEAVLPVVNSVSSRSKLNLPSLLSFVVDRYTEAAEDALKEKENSPSEKGSSDDEEEEEGESKGPKDKSPRGLFLYCLEAGSSMWKESKDDSDTEESEKLFQMRIYTDGFVWEESGKLVLFDTPEADADDDSRLVVDQMKKGILSDVLNPDGLINVNIVARVIENVASTDEGAAKAEPEEGEKLEFRAQGFAKYEVYPPSEEDPSRDVFCLCGLRPSVMSLNPRTLKDRYPRMVVPMCCSVISHVPPWEEGDEKQYVALGQATEEEMSGYEGEAALLLCEIPNPKPLVRVVLKGYCSGLEVVPVPNSRPLVLCAASDWGSACLFFCDTATGEEKLSLTGYPDNLQLAKVVSEWDNATFAAGGPFMICGAVVEGEEEGESAEDTASWICRYDFSQGVKIGEYKPLGWDIGGILPHATEKCFFSVDSAKRLKLWSRDLYQRESMAKLSGRGFGLCYLAGNQEIAVALSTGDVEIWDPRSMSEMVRKLELATLVGISEKDRMGPPKMVPLMGNQLGFVIGKWAFTCDVAGTGKVLVKRKFPSMLLSAGYIPAVV